MCSVLLGWWSDHPVVLVVDPWTLSHSYDRVNRPLDRQRCSDSYQVVAVPRPPTTAQVSVPARIAAESEFPDCCAECVQFCEYVDRCPHAVALAFGQHVEHACRGEPVECSVGARFGFMVDPALDGGIAGATALVKMAELIRMLR